MSWSPFTEPSLKELGLEVGEPAGPGWNAVALPEMPLPPDTFTLDELLSVLQSFEAQLRPMRLQTHELEQNGDITAKWYRAQLAAYISSQREFLLGIPGISSLRALCGAFWGEDLTTETVRRIKGQLHVRCGLSAEESGSIQVSEAALRFRTVIPIERDEPSAITGSRSRNLLESASDTVPTSTSRLPKEVEILLDEAKRAYASNHSRVWLVAVPSGSKMQRCTDPFTPESSKDCGRIIDGVVYLPLLCFTGLGEVNLKNGQAVSFMIDAAGDEMTAFYEFSRRAGAALVAHLPDWNSCTGMTDPATMWATALMFTAPEARRHLPEWRNDCQVITEPWAASCAALRDWNVSSVSSEMRTQTDELGQTQPSEMAAKPDTPRFQPASLKQPLDKEIAVYRYWLVTGKKQVELSEDPELMKIVGRKLHQGTISVWIKKVKKWLEAGNVLPVLGESANAKPSAIDPETIDVGKRLDALTKRQRKKKSDPD